MNSKKFKVLFVCLTGILFSMPAVVFAGADSGFYIGLGGGNSTVKSGDYSDSAAGYKVFGGYNFGVVPFIDLAVEASYVEFGNFTNTTASVEAVGLNAFGLAGFNFGPFGIFAKAGVIDWGLDTNDGILNNSESGTDPAYGVGAKIALGSFSVRAEYEYYDLDYSFEMGMASISAIYTF